MRASACAVHLLRCLVAGGVRELVLAPGSRSAPLAIAAYAADAAGDLRLHVRVDERAAGFLALGLTMGSGRPAAVVTTSGTAVGNLLPAVMEARHSGRQLLVVSADRPALLRGTGANQTTWQAGVFGRFAPCTDLAVDTDEAQLARAVREACARTGPSHLNVQLGPPLVPAAEPWWPGPEAVGPAAVGLAAWQAPVPAPATAAHDEPEVLAPGPRTVVVAGDGAGPSARRLAEAGRLPLLAEPTSGARAGDHAIGMYRLLLATRLAAQIERVVVVGHPTLSRPVTDLLTRPDVELLSVLGPGGIASDPGRHARRLGVVPVAGQPGDEGWLATWQRADRQVTSRLAQYLDTLPELHALQVAQQVADALTPGTTLVVGSSNPIRDLDLVLAPYPPGERRLVVGNRGLAGIDGTVSTAIGVAIGRGHMADADDGGARDSRPSGVALGLLGDLTFLHDSTGLLLGPREPRPDLTFVIVNDDGGSIFSLLEQGAPAYAAAFERVFATPTGTDLASLCAASGTAYRRVLTRKGLATALAEPTRGIRVLEARVGRADRRTTAAALAALTDGVG
ncbi:MAG: 2-succinyl-5-enolpyruvyl-6-hydroxy-3-cyclohexene-1-carboxylic-acid synthase [Dermatophilaceae bacterium]